MKEHNGKLYMVRNVSLASSLSDAQSFTDNSDAGNPTRKTSSTTYRNGMEAYYGELWVCDPTSSGVTDICDSADWTQLINGKETDLGGATPTANSISMLEFVGDTAYIGFDDPTNGVQIFAMKLGGGDIVATDLVATGGATTSSFDTDNDSTWDNGEWKQAGTDGLGASSRNLYIFSSSTITDVFGDNYLFVNVADDNTYAIRVYRQLGEYQPL